MSKKTKIQRNKTVSIKVSEDEFALINLYASQKPHVSVSDYVRDKALKQTVKPLQVTEDDLKKLKEFTEKKKSVGKQEEKINKENEYLKKFLEIMSELGPKVKSNGYINYKDGGQQLLSLIALERMIKENQ